MARKVFEARSNDQRSMILKSDLEGGRVHEMGKRTSSSAGSWSMPAGREGHSSAYAVLRHFLISADARHM